MSINQDLKDNGLSPRTALIIYLTNISDQFKLRRYGDIVYFSKKMKYCVLYVDSNEAEREKKKISALDFVRYVDLSEQDNIDLSAEHIEGQIADLAKKAEDKLQKEQQENEDLFK